MAILTAIDGGPNSDRVVETGDDLANAYGDELVVSHVIPKETFESRTKAAPDYYRDDAIQDAKTVAQELVEDVLGSEQDVRLLGRVGRPAEEVLDIADQVDARFIVVGGRRRTPIGKAVFGSDTQEILLNSQIPIVAVMGEIDE